MSNSGDSFEKIELEQSVLAEAPARDQQSADLATSDQQSTLLTTSDQQSAGLITSDQHSSSKSPATSDQQSADLTTSDQQSTLLTSDQQSTGLITSDQHASGKSPVTMMSSSTTKTVQLEDLEFELDWKIRDEIIGNVNQHTALLSGLTINSDTREKLKKVNRDLVAALMDLPVKDDDRSKSFESLESGPDGGLNEFVLYLTADMKARIVDTLMANQHVILVGAASFSSERKAKLINQNIDLAYELLKLRVRTGAIASDSSTSKEDRLIYPETKTSESHTTSNSTANEEEKLDDLDNHKSCPTVDEVAILKEELKELKEQFEGSVIGNLQENVQGLEKKLAASKGELDELKVRVEAGRSETTITFELKGIEALLVLGPGSERNSKNFFCGGMYWHLKVRLSVENEVQWLGVFLQHKHNGQDRWSIVAAYEVRLLSSGAVGSDVFSSTKYQVFKKPSESIGYGWNKFITVDKLRSGSFIQDDTIKFRVHLTTQNFEKVVDL